MANCVRSAVQLTYLSGLICSNILLSLLHPCICDVIIDHRRANVDGRCLSGWLASFSFKSGKKVRGSKAGWLQKAQDRVIMSSQDFSQRSQAWFEESENTAEFGTA